MTGRSPAKTTSDSTAPATASSPDGTSTRREASTSRAVLSHREGSTCSEASTRHGTSTHRGASTRHGTSSRRTAPTRRAALSALITGMVAAPLAVAPALADPAPHADAHGGSRGESAHDPRTGERRRADADARAGAQQRADAASPLAPPSTPFAPEVPRGVSADVVLAGYAQLSDDPGDYGGYSLARRTPADVHAIIIHDTEVDYPTTLKIFQNPESYASIHYVIREDGHITQMVRGQDVAWHAGNWTFNQSAIGIELIGVAEDPSHYTDAQYAATGRLVRYLAQKWEVPLDREHVLAHEDLPGTSAKGQADMHWDPGAYYDWEKLQRAAGIPTVAGSPRRLRGTVTIAPHYATNTLAFTSCNEGSPALPARPTSTLMVRTEPRSDAPLLVDPALEAAPGSTGGSDHICDWGDQVSFGQTFAVAEERGDWVGIWISGQVGWIHRRDAAGRPAVNRGPKGTRVVTPAGKKPVAVHGAAFPAPAVFERAGVEAPKNEPLPYTLAPGQKYVVEAEHRAEYYVSPMFDGSGADWVREDAVWLRIQLNHRSAFVRASDVVDA